MSSSSRMLPNLSTEERKRRKMDRDRRYRQQIINIGDQIGPWKEMIKDLGMANNRDFTQMLLECYRKNVLGQAQASDTVVQTSMPQPSESVEDLQPTSKVRGCRPLNSAAAEYVKQMETKSRYRIDIESDGVASQEPTDVTCDPAYDPQCRVTIRDSFLDNGEAGELDLVTNVHNISVFSDEDDDGDSNDPHGKMTDAAVQTIHSPTLGTVTTRRYIVEELQILQLAGLVPLKPCERKGCNQPLVISTKKCGTAVYVKWTCSAGHLVYQWCSQSKLSSGVLTGNFLFCSSAVLSGNSFTKLALFGKFMNLGVPSPGAYSRVRAHYVVPQVDRFWTVTQAGVLRQLKSDVVLSGSASFHSPGSCAKFCTYTLLDHADNKILAMATVDKGETTQRSELMEAEGFRVGMTQLMDAGVKVKEVITDAHPQISALINQMYPNVQHSYDIWHGAKNFGEKVIAAANDKMNQELRPWIKDVTNHFVHCAQECDGDVEILIAKWVSILQHVVKTHKRPPSICDHEYTEEESDGPRLIADNHTHTTLSKLVLDKHLLRTLPHYASCQSTCELQTCSDHIQMYTSEQQSSQFHVYKCQCQLAAIDYQQHLDRPYLKTEDGTIRYCKRYSKAAGNYIATPLKVPKEYMYIPTLQLQILDAYCQNHQKLPLRSNEHLGDNDQVVPPHTGEGVVHVIKCEPVW